MSFLSKFRLCHSTAFVYAQSDGSDFMNAPIMNFAVSADGLASFDFKGSTTDVASISTTDVWFTIAQKG